MSTHRFLRGLLPRSFRERHGDAMQQAFDEALRRARTRGRLAASRVWIREALDLTRTAVILRVRPLSEGRPAVGRSTGGQATNLSAVRDDLVSAARALVRRPAHTAFAAFTLALGVGATAAIYSALDLVVLRPLPFPGGERVVELWVRIGSTSFVSPAAEQIEAWREGAADLIESMEAYELGSTTLTGVGDAAFLPAASIRPSLFALIDAEPLLGRVFTSDETKGAGGRVVLLGHSLWRSRFASDPSVVGRSISLDGEPWTVIGVMGPDALLPSTMGRRVDFWRPLGEQASPDQAVARLRAGATVEALTQRLATIDQGLREQGGGEIRPGVARPVAAIMGGSLRDTLWVLMAAVLLLLAIAAVNVSGLMLSHSESRRRETALRAALGASRHRLRRQILSESLVLALLGGALGLGVAYGSLQIIQALRPSSLGLLDEARVDVRVLAFGFAVASLLGFVMAVAPALTATARPPADSVRLACPTRKEGSVKWILVSGQVALSFALVTACLAVLWSLDRMQSRDPGFEARGLLVADLRLPPWKYQEEDERRATFGIVLERLSSVQGVSGVSLASGAPPGVGIWFGQVEVEGSPQTEETHVFHGPSVTSDYFTVLRQPLLEGRPFSEREIEDRASLFILGEAAARRFFPGGGAVGQRIRIGSGEKWYTIVGVARDVAMRGLGDELGELQIYAPIAAGWEFGVRHAIFVRAESEGARIAAELRPLILSEEPDALLEISPARGLLIETLARERFATALLTAFACLALLLSSVGLYGVLSHGVGRRQREIGVRVSLGAGASEVRRLIIGSGLKAGASGIAVGTVLAFWGMRLVSGHVVGLPGTRWPAYAAAATVLLLTTLAACWLPARRAARVDPMRALRSE